jgi:hypothetical protein
MHYTTPLTTTLSIVKNTRSQTSRTSRQSCKFSLKGEYHENSVLKGQCHEEDNFFERLNILISTFCVCADGFQGLSKVFTSLHNYSLF